MQSKYSKSPRDLRASEMGSRSVAVATAIFEDSLYACKTAKAAGYTVFGLYDEFSAGRKDEMISICDSYFEDFKKAKQELL